MNMKNLLILLLIGTSASLSYLYNEELNNIKIVKEIKIKEVEVPVEKIVYKYITKEVEVPVEKIVYKTKIKWKWRNRAECRVPDNKTHKVVYQEKIVYKTKDKIINTCNQKDYAKVKLNLSSGYGRIGTNIKDNFTNVEVSPKNGWVNGAGFEYSPENSNFYYGINATTNGNYMFNLSYEFDVFK